MLSYMTGWLGALSRDASTQNQCDIAAMDPARAPGFGPAMVDLTADVKKVWALDPGPSEGAVLVAFDFLADSYTRLRGLVAEER